MYAMNMAQSSKETNSCLYQITQLFKTISLLKVILYFFSLLELENDYKDPDPGNFVTNEDDGLRLKWTAYLEFTQNQDVADMTWDKVTLQRLSYKFVCL